MKNNIFYSIAIALLLLLGACNNDDIVSENINKSERILSITASMPDDGPQTRVSLDKLENNTIALKWQDGDKLDLVFVQGETKQKETITITSITDDGKKAQFNIPLPDDIEGQFSLYGVYGGGGLDDKDPTQVILPVNAGKAGSLEKVQERKDVMLYFASEDINVAKPSASVTFKHLGSLFSVTFKNTSGSAIEGLKEARLVGVGGDEKWAYNNITNGNNTYNLATGEFLDQESAGNFITLKAEKASLAVDETATFWGWYPPIPGKVWPELKLELHTTTTDKPYVSYDTKAKKDQAPEAGMSYSFYAAWKNEALAFTDKELTAPLGPAGYHIMPMGDLRNMLTSTQRDTITTMIITGEMNKSDFTRIKQRIKNLTYLDLKDVKCEFDQIPLEALKGHKKIKTIILPTSIKTIENEAFSGCSGLSGTMVFPEGLKNIEASAFSNCTGITSLDLPTGLTTIGENAFFGCIGLKGSLKLPSGLESIEKQAFNGCTGLTSLDFSDNGVKTIGINAFSACTELIGKLILKKGLKTIGDGAFGGLNFTALELPEGLETIGASAFASCTTLKGSLEFKKGLKTIGASAFSDCEGFDGKLTFYQSDDPITIGEKAFHKCGGFTGSLKLPDGLTTIESQTFLNCSGFNGTLTLPSNLTTIKEKAFDNCTNFKILTSPLPASLTTIATYAFYNCESLTGTLIFPISLESIGNGGFQDCYGFSAFQFPHNEPIPFTPLMLPYKTTLVPPGTKQAYIDAKYGDEWNIKEY